MTRSSDAAVTGMAITLAATILERIHKGRAVGRQRKGRRDPLSYLRAGVPLGLGAALVAAGGLACNKPSQKIVVGQVQTGTTMTPLYVADGEGFFKREGLDVETQALSGGTPSAMAALASGNINVLASGATEVIQYTAKKVIAGKMIGELSDSTYDLVVSKGIGNVQQLKGQVLGISAPNGGDDIWLRAILQHYGVSDKDVTFISSGNPLNRLTALSVGSVQAIAASNSNRDSSVKIGNLLLRSSDSPIQVPSGVFVATDDFIKTKKPALQTFFKAMGEATEWIRANPKGAAAYCAKGTGASLETCVQAVAVYTNPVLTSKYTWSPTFALNIEGVRAAIAVDNNLIPESKGLKLSDLVDTSVAGTVP